jgi:hypothetical protein
MRKCIDLESHPGFEEIQSPVLMQAIDRGLQGFSGTGVIDWGHIPPVPKTKPGRKAKGKAVPLPPTPPVDPKVVNPAKLGDEKHHRYFEYLFNTFATPEARAIINKYPKPELVPWNGGGYFQPSEGRYGAVYTPMGMTNDISTLFHEYGHALDHIIGLELHKSNTALATSEMFWNEMIADGEKMGMIVDDSIYWNYITENGINFKITTRRDFRVTKGKTRQDIERNMNPGDHWRIMEYLLKKVKTDLQNIKNTKNPDPAKVKKAEATKKSMEKLYDLYMKRIEVAKKIRSLVMKSKIGKAKRDRTAQGGIYRQRGAIGDILDALTAGELYDYQVATGIKFMLGGHGPGYYNTRKDSSGGHHWSLKMADMFRRAEVWAQLHQFLAHQDNTSWDIMKNLMPNTVKRFDALMKEASAGNLAANQLREIGTQQIRANPRMETNLRMDTRVTPEEMRHLLSAQKVLMQPSNTVQATAEEMEKYFRDGIGRKQRHYSKNDPENIMKRYQDYAGGGSMAHHMEHLGDLLWRVTHAAPYRMAEIDGKVSNGIAWLSTTALEFHGREPLDNTIDPRKVYSGFLENLKSNAEYDKREGRVPPTLEGAKKMIKEYGEAHARLPVYNKTQWLLREVPIAISKFDYVKARALLLIIQKLRSNNEEFWRGAEQITKNKNGKVIEYKPPKGSAISKDTPNLAENIRYGELYYEKFDNRGGKDYYRKLSPAEREHLSL